jgi:hypothetical protein
MTFRPFDDPNSINGGVNNTTGIAVVEVYALN